MKKTHSIKDAMPSQMEEIRLSFMAAATSAEIYTPLTSHKKVDGYFELFNNNESIFSAIYKHYTGKDVTLAINSRFYKIIHGYEIKDFTKNVIGYFVFAFDRTNMYLWVVSYLIFSSAGVILILLFVYTFIKKRIVSEVQIIEQKQSRT